MSKWLCAYARPGCVSGGKGAGTSWHVRTFNSATSNCGGAFCWLRVETMIGRQPSWSTDSWPEHSCLQNVIDDECQMSSESRA